ncbi:hypothetical protein LguiA_022823 [Lonicera macranthoides]
MAMTSRSILHFSVLVSLFLISSSQTCSDYTFTSNRVYSSCINLPHLHAYLHWNYSLSTAKVSIAYRARQTSRGWIAWGINPQGMGMIGSQAIIAFHNHYESLTVYPTVITSYRPSMLPGTLSFQVSNVSAEFANNEMIIFAVVGPLADPMNVNHVWQVGRSVLNDIPQMHSVALSNLQSMGKLDFTSG